tara:strand:- start:222 stop:914 length:693 start_codon:yes stop_codon:yes gene_type:complete
MGKADLRIDWATHESAKYACVNWHYSGCLPSGKLVKVGAWENGKFIGVVLFGRGATPRLGSPYNLGQDECVELVRIALDNHETEVSRIAAIAMKFLKQSNPNLRLIVSFADTSQGHHGGIYQAGNWVYNGQGSAARFWMVFGKLTHPRTVIARGGSNTLLGAKNIDPNAKAVVVSGKHRYLMPLDTDMRNRILQLSKPYPKRVKQAMTDDQSAQRQCSTDPHAPKDCGKV